MIIITATRRLLRPLSKHTNIRRFNKCVLRTLVTYSNKSVKFYKFPQLEQKRYYAEWSPNIIKSTYPDFEIPRVTLTDFLWDKADSWSDFTALVCGLTERELKYKQLKIYSRRLATSLLKEGYKSGQVIAMIMPNMPEFTVVALGILEAGLVITTINPMYTAEEIAYQLKDSGAEAIFSIPEKLKTVLEAEAILRSENNKLNFKVFCINDVNGNETELPSTVDKYSRLITDDVDDSALSSLKTKDQTTNDVILIPYSSGTTGKPKGVCLTHRNLISTLMAMHILGDVEEPTADRQDIIPAILPAFHIYGFNVVILQSLYCGAKIVTLPKFEEKSFLDLLKKYECSVLYVAPPLVLYIGLSPNVTKEHLRALKVILSGAAPIADSDILKCVEKSPSTVHYKQGYGMTETSPVISGMDKGIKKYSSVGSLAANTLGKISDLQTNQALGPNEEGEICIKGPQVMKGYLNNEKATKEVFDSEGWFHTGDIGYYDEDNHIFITDRLKELIKVKGFQVAPAELEALLRSHPNIDDAAVFGISDARKGESPIGYVKIKNGTKVTKEELKAFLAPKIANYKQIDDFVFVESIPKSAAGKILRKDMKADYLKMKNI